MIEQEPFIAINDKYGKVKVDLLPNENQRVRLLYCWFKSNDAACTVQFREVGSNTKVIPDLVLLGANTSNSENWGYLGLPIPKAMSIRIKLTAGTSCNMVLRWALENI